MWTGILLGTLCVLAAMRLEGGSFSAFLSLPALLIVVGGSLGASLVSFRISQLQAFWETWGGIQDLASRGEGLPARLARYAGIVRHGGLLKLDPEIAREPDPLLRLGMREMVEGSGLEHAAASLERQFQKELQALAVGERFFEAVGGYSPTFGIIGTVMALVAVLSDLSQPEKLAHGIAAAFVATFYGVLLANLLILPIAARIREQSMHYSEHLDQMLLGLQLVYRGEAPLSLAERLSQKAEGKSREHHKSFQRTSGTIQRIASSV